MVIWWNMMNMNNSLHTFCCLVTINFGGKGVEKAAYMHDSYTEYIIMRQQLRIIS